MYLAEKGEVHCFIKIREHIHFIDTKEWEIFISLFHSHSC